MRSAVAAVGEGTAWLYREIGLTGDVGDTAAPRFGFAPMGDVGGYTGSGEIGETRSGISSAVSCGRGGRFGVERPVGRGTP